MKGAKERKMSRSKTVSNKGCGSASAYTSFAHRIQTQSTRKRGGLPAVARKRLCISRGSFSRGGGNRPGSEKRSGGNRGKAEQGTHGGDLDGAAPRQQPPASSRPRARAWRGEREAAAALLDSSLTERGRTMTGILARP
jgi:hypothetical protein